MPLDGRGRIMQPVNDGGHSFWDHLSVTRADEYAAEEELARLPIPPVPLAPLPVSVPAYIQANVSDPILSETGQRAWPDDATVPPLVERKNTPFGHGPAGPAAQHAAKQAAHMQPAPQKRRGPRGATTGRLAYRLQRLWLTPLVRRMVTIGLPVGLVLISLGLFLLDESRRAYVVAQADAAYALFVDRPEFMVTGLDLSQRLPAEIETAIREVVEPELPQSSFRLDLAMLRAELERLDAIRLADLRLTSDNQLSIGITQRVPAILWRSAAGLEVLDAEGVRIGFVTDRTALPDLPLVAGEGANSHVGEALDLVEAASPLGPRLLGLVRMGDRRWDVVLDRDQTIRLPELAPIAALERIIALDQAQDLLARDVMVTDLRNPTRPILQVSAGALETIRALRGTSLTERVAQ
jgi:cell division protein FtsQ